MEKRKNFMIQFCETLQRYPSIWNTHSYSVGSFSRNREERSKAISAIARELNITDIAVKNRYESVRRQLRDILQRQNKATCNGHLPTDIKHDKWYLYKYIIFLKDSLSKRRKFAYKGRPPATKKKLAKLGVISRVHFIYAPTHPNRTFDAAHPVKEEETDGETGKCEPVELQYEEVEPMNAINISAGCSSSLRSSSSPPPAAANINPMTSPLMSPMDGSLIQERHIHQNERLPHNDRNEQQYATPYKVTSTNHFFGNYVNGMLNKLPENVANVTMVEISAILSNALVESGLCE